jgi:hypothetical protein
MMREDSDSIEESGDDEAEEEERLNKESDTETKEKRIRKQEMKPMKKGFDSFF